MLGLRQISLSLAAVTAVTVPVATATTLSGPKAASSASPSSPTDAPDPAPGITHIKVEKPFDIVLDSKGSADASMLPTPATLFTRTELAQVIPGLSAVSISDDTQTLTIKGDSSNTIQIVLKRFGTKDSVAKAWKQEKNAHIKRSGSRQGLYTFFNGSVGASDAFTDGTNTHVLVTKGNVAGDIWFSGAGFTQLGQDYAASRQAYTKKVVPALVRLIADKLAKSSTPASTPSSTGTASAK